VERGWGEGLTFLFLKIHHAALPKEVVEGDSNIVPNRGRSKYV